MCTVAPRRALHCSESLALACVTNCQPGLPVHSGHRNLDQPQHPVTLFPDTTRPALHRREYSLSVFFQFFDPVWAGCLEPPNRESMRKKKFGLDPNSLVQKLSIDQTYSGATFLFIQSTLARRFGVQILLFRRHSRMQYFNTSLYHPEPFGSVLLVWPWPSPMFHLSTLAPLGHHSFQPLYRGI